MKNNISAIIVVKNNPPHLQETIDSINDFVDEILIGDIGMKKELLACLTKNKKIKIIKIKKDIPYAELIKEELKNKAKGEFIITLDPDEIFSPGLKNIIIKNFKNYDYFKIPRKNIIFGHWIRHSRWWPDYQIRFFKKNKVFFSKTIYSPPHTQPKTRGKMFTVLPKKEFSIIHYNYNNLDDYLSRAIHYAKAEAQTYIAEKKQLTFEETIKKALNELISRYFAAQGYKDGLIGLTLSILQMFYYFLVYFYFIELKKFKMENENNNSPLLIRKFFQNGLFETNFWLEKENLDNTFGKFKNKLINKLIKLLSK